MNKEIDNKIINESKTEKNNNTYNFSQINENNKSKINCNSSNLQNSAFKAIKSEQETAFM